MGAPSTHVRRRKESLNLYNSFHSILCVKSREEYVSLTVECLICASVLEVISA